MIIRNKFNGYVNGNNRLYPGGGGGQQPSSTSQSTTTIPEYARPYVERMLGKAEAFSETPYQAYGGQRVAGFTPLQEQSFKGAGNLGPAQQIGQGTQLAGMAGLGGLGAGQQYAQQATNPYAMQSYMSPYMENALAPQLREAARASAIQGQQNQAQAVQQGAFGGSRSAIVEAERQRNLGQQQADIYGRGMQTAFEQARQAQQFGADLGLRGYGMAGQMAGTLGQLGQTQFGQQQGAIQAQAAAGAQQQAQEQQGLSQAYQDFLTQRGYPQQQLSFMSDILRGVPLGQQTQVQYQAPPPMSSQLAQLGLGAYGVSQMMKKEGGVIKMAEGGIAGAAPSGYSVPPEKLMGMMKKMPTEQLQEIGRSTDNAMTLGIVDAEMNRRQMMEDGQILSRSMPEGTVRDAMMGIDQAPLPDSMFADTAVGEYVPEAPAEEAPVEAPAEPMRSGGIVAFAKGKEVKAAPPDDIAALRAMDPSKALMTEQERTTAEEQGLARLEKFLGPDRSIELAEKVAKASELSPAAESNAKAAAAFEMMAAFGEPVPFATAAGKAGAIAGRNMREYEKLKRESEKEANKLRLDTARYERADKMQRYGEANKIADRMEGRKEKLFTLDMAQKQELAKVQLKEKEMANELTKARIAAGPGYAAANRPTDFMQARNSFMSAALADYKAKNPGKEPSELELANMNKAATENAAAAMRQYSGQIGQERVDLDKKTKASTQAREELELNPRLISDLNKKDKKDGLEPGTSQQAWLRNREKEILGGPAQTPPPSDQTTPPPPAAVQYKEGDTAKDKTGKPIVFRSGTWVYQQ
jgi:hypothetical protein